MFLVESTFYFCIYIYYTFVNYVIANVNWMTGNPSPVDKFNITILSRSELAVVRVDPDPM